MKAALMVETQAAWRAVWSEATWAEPMGCSQVGVLVAMKAMETVEMLAVLLVATMVSTAVASKAASRVGKREATTAGGWAVSMGADLVAESAAEKAV